MRRRVTRQLALPRPSIFGSDLGFEQSAEEDLCNRQQGFAHRETLQDVGRSSERTFLSAAKASELQGLLNFVVSFYMGRGLKHLVSTFMPFVEGQRHHTPGELANLCSFV